MKTIKLAVDGQYRTIDIIRVVAELPSTAKGGIGVADIRRRVRLLDAVEAVTPDQQTISFEDADYDYLKKLLESFQNFSVANKQLLQIIDSIVNEN